MTARNYYHVGFLVHDIDAARDRFAAVTGLDFTPVQTMRFDHFHDDRGDRPLEITLCYSSLGPPFIELVQADPAGGVFGAHHGEGFHHLGFHRAAPESWLEHAPAKLEQEAARFGNRDAERLASLFTAPSGLHGVRLEIVDERARAAFFEWLGGQGAQVSG